MSIVSIAANPKARGVYGYQFSNFTGSSVNIFGSACISPLSVFILAVILQHTYEGLHRIADFAVPRPFIWFPGWPVSSDSALFPHKLKHSVEDGIQDIRDAAAIACKDS